MKKTILMAIVATFLISSCHKASSFTPCKGEYEGYPLYTKKGKCYYLKGVTGFSYKQIDKANCGCI